MFCPVGHSPVSRLNGTPTAHGVRTRVLFRKPQQTCRHQSEGYPLSVLKPKRLLHALWLSSRRSSSLLCPLSLLRLLRSLSLSLSCVPSVCEAFASLSLTTTTIANCQTLVKSICSYIRYISPSQNMRTSVRYATSYQQVTRHCQHRRACLLTTASGVGVFFRRR
jgi:hypothetical protein